MKQLTKSDCHELFYALCDENLMKKIGIDGVDLALGLVTLTAEEAEGSYFALLEKRERMQEGFFDDYKGQVKNPWSITGRWERHLGRIMAKLMPVAAGGKDNHVQTSLHRTGCVACQMAYDERLPDAPSAACAGAR